MADVVPGWGWFLVALGAVIVAIPLLSRTLEPRFSLKDKVVVITGGSAGIGKAIGKLAAQRGCHVALIARRPDVLSSAGAEISACRKSPAQRVSTHTADVSNDTAMAAALADVAAAHGGGIDVVIANAGVSLPRTFEDGSAEDFEDLLRVNVVGCRHTAFHALPFMANRREGARIVFVSSQAGQVGMYGYSQYSATKFALRGLAEALSMELAHRRILVSLCFPPDTDTPLYELRVELESGVKGGPGTLNAPPSPHMQLENVTKPALTKQLSASTALVQPEVVAAALLRGIERWRFFISVGFDGWMLSTVTAGMAPAGSLLTATVQVLTMGLWRAIALLYLGYFYRTVRLDNPRPPSQRLVGAGSSK